MEDSVKMRNLLVTGGSGFIGSHFIDYVLEQDTFDTVVNLDKLTYAGNIKNNAKSGKNSKYFFKLGDISDKSTVFTLIKAYNITHIINFAAETHVDNSLEDDEPFFQTNVHGTHVLLELVRELKIKKYIQVSTDEVYGHLGKTGSFHPSTPLNPRNPYSKSKADADRMVIASRLLHNLPVLITRCSNNYGPRQHVEKLIPKTITNAAKGEKIPVYGDGTNIRDWIHVKDHVRGLYLALQYGNLGQIYHFGGNNELSNKYIVRHILDEMKKPTELIEFVEDRENHDFRYSMDFTRTTMALGWVPEIDFVEGMKDTISSYF
jgi:dTDP-glucose 4,6-dehydratase